MNFINFSGANFATKFSALKIRKIVTSETLNFNGDNLESRYHFRGQKTSKNRIKKC